MDDDELDFVQPQPKFDTSKVEMSLDDFEDSQSSKELEKHMTTYRDYNEQSQNRSFASKSQNLSQVSSNSRVADLFNQISKNNRRNRGRAFVNRGSSMMLMHSQSQSQSACVSQNASRVGSKYNSRVNSGRNTPRGLKPLPNQ